MDITLFFLINHGLANPFFDVLMPALTSQGYLLAGPFLLYALYRGAAGRDNSGKTFLRTAIAAIVISLISVALADFACSWLKAVTARPRPCQALEGVRLIVSCPSSFSFPSSHGATSFAFMTPYFVLARRFLQTRWLALLFVAASLIALSRAYLGVHYLSDIVAGAALGAAIGGMMCRVNLMILKRSNVQNDNL